MIIHIGFDKSVDSSDVIAIFAKESITPGCSAFIDRMKGEGCFTGSTEGERSYLLLDSVAGSRIIASPIRSKTLGQRFSAPIFEMSAQ